MTTPAILTLRGANVAFTEHTFPYVDRGGTAHSSRVLGVQEHIVIKTLVFEDEHKQPLVVLMHGDCEVSTKALARLLGKKLIKPCAPDVAQKHSGYQVGGTSPFGMKKPLPVYMERSIAALALVYINGGGRGLLVSLAPNEIVRVLGPVLVDVAQPPPES